MRLHPKKNKGAVTKASSKPVVFPRFKGKMSNMFDIFRAAANVKDIGHRFGEWRGK